MSGRIGLELKCGVKTNKGDTDMKERSSLPYDNVILGEEVAEALNERKPVVAVETGYLAHKEKVRNHIEDAGEIVKCIRENNAVPSVVAIFEGKVNILLS